MGHHRAPGRASAEYHFYAALSRAAACASATAAERPRHLDAIVEHHRQLQVWAENCPENFENRAALVGAELARLDGRDADAMRLYEQAIRSARDNGFVQNEALAYEVAARHYAARGFEDFAQVYLRKARDGYLRWGAGGKVRHLDAMYPLLRREESAPWPTSTIGAPVEHLDLATVIKVSQAISRRSVGYRGVGRHITERKRAEETLREVQMALAHANRLATMGQLTASIAHEVNQPIAAAVTNAHAALRWLRAPQPDFEEVQQALRRIVENGNRASEVIGRIRALIKKAPPRTDSVAINNAILEVVALTYFEAAKSGIAVRTELAEGLSPIRGDRVQLQQVILNLVINAIEAMSGVSEGPRELLISSGKAEVDGVMVAVRDSGPGVAPATLDHLFEAFHTTKPSGLGLGLSICRSIIEAHGGRLWASANVPRGAVFQFTIPVNSEIAA